MTDKKVKKLQEKAQAAAYDVFNTLTRLGVWQAHLVVGQPITGEFEELTLAGMTEAALLSDLDNISVTLAQKPRKEVEITTTPEEVDADEPSGD